MRESPSNFRPGWSGLRWTLTILAVAFLLQNIFEVWLGISPMVTGHFGGLSWQGMGQGLVYTTLSYGLLHGGLMHFVFNGLTIFFFGRPVQMRLGNVRFVELFWFGVLLGGIIFLATVLVSGRDALLIGASAGALAILTVFCFHHWSENITLYLYFVIPVRLSGRIIFYFTLALQGFYFLFVELPGSGASNVGFSAHMGGMLGGFIYDRYLSRYPTLFDWIRSPKNVSIQRPNRQQRRKATLRSRAVGKFQVNMESRKAVKKEVDRILDKINEEGFGALSEEEKTTLDRAKDVLR